MCNVGVCVGCLTRDFHKEQQKESFSTNTPRITCWKYAKSVATCLSPNRHFASTGAFILNDSTGSSFSSSGRIDRGCGCGCSQPPDWSRDRRAGAGSFASPVLLRLLQHPQADVGGWITGWPSRLTAGFVGITRHRAAPLLKKKKKITRTRF